MNTLLTWAGGLGGLAAGVKVLIDVLLSRAQARKLDAEGHKTHAEGSVMLVNSATGWAQQITQRLDAVTNEFDKYKREQQTRQEAQAKANAAHSKWDSTMYNRLKELGVRVPPPPPLTVE